MSVSTKYNKAYRFRLLPNREQETMFAKTFGCARFIWNKLLAYADSHYKEHGKTDFTTPAKFKVEYEWLKEVDSLALANVQLNLEKAYKSFFKKTAKFPRFKSKRDTHQSYTTNNQTAVENTVENELIVSDNVEIGELI